MKNNPHTDYFIGSAVSSVWVTMPEYRALRRINLFGKLKEGWDFGEGVPSPPGVVADAKTVLRTIVSCGIPKTDAFPGTDGEIIVTGYLERECFEFVVRIDRCVDIIIEQNDKEVFSTEGIALSKLPVVLNKNMEKQWHTSGSYTPLNMTAKNDNFEAQPFSHPQKHSAFLFSTITAA